jgi:hypothetical protein
MKRLILIPIMFLAACTPTPPPEPIVRTIEVKVPVSVYCDEDPQPPVFANNNDALAAAPNVLEVIKLHIAGTGQRIDFQREQAAALAVCRGEP